MKYFLLALLIPLACNAADESESVVVSTDIVCYKLERLVDTLIHKYKEDPIFLGKSLVEKDAYIAMYVNKEFGTYTVVQAGNGVGCILDSGKNVKYRMPTEMQKYM